MARRFMSLCPKALSYVVLSSGALAITGLDISPVLGSDLPVAAADIGCGVVLMREGDLFLSGRSNPCPSPQSDWVLLGNVFLSAGRAPGLIVGMNQHGHVLAGNGDWFQLALEPSCSSFSATFRSNVFDVTGVREPGEEFLTFGGGAPSGGYAYGVTTHGNVFRWSGCSGWEYLGAIIKSGPTNVGRPSWGKLKAIYR